MSHDLFSAPGCRAAWLRRRRPAKSRLFDALIRFHTRHVHRAAGHPQRIALLHTPLMSLTNAISAIAVVGSIVLAGTRETGFTTFLGAVAVFASMTNIVSGFLLTDRMLKMFKKREPGKS